MLSCLLMNMQDYKIKNTLTEDRILHKIFTYCQPLSWDKKQIFSQKWGLLHENTLFSALCISLQFIQSVGSSWRKLGGPLFGMMFLCFLLSGMNSGIYLCIPIIIPFTDCNMRR